MIQTVNNYVRTFLSASLTGENIPCISPSIEEWHQIYQCAAAQGVSALVYDGIMLCKAELPVELKNQWRANTIASYVRNEQLLDLQEVLIKRLEEFGISVAVLKGTSLSVTYAKPAVRALGDIDLLIHAKDREKTERVLLELDYSPKETNHPFHLDFYGHGAVVELHWSASTFPNTAGGRFAQMTMERAVENVCTASLDGHSFPVLQPIYQALSLLLHMERHMTEYGIGLRQLADWSQFAVSIDSMLCSEEMDCTLNQCGLLKFAKVLTKTAMQYLNLSIPNAESWCQDISQTLCDDMMTSIFRFGSMGRADQTSPFGRMLMGRGDHRQAHSMARNLFVQLTRLVEQQFPITKKVKILLPVLWVYIPIRYVVRIILGKREKVSIEEALSIVEERNALHRRLEFFNTKF